VRDQGSGAVLPGCSGSLIIYSNFAVAPAKAAPDAGSAPPSPLLSRQTSEETPSDPAINVGSLCESELSLPISFRMAAA
jgi:hypothetical protein